MKLRQTVKLPPEQLRLTVPGELMQELSLYVQYQNESGVTWEPKELSVEIIRVFLKEGDRKFLLWKRQQRNGAGKALRLEGSDTVRNEVENSTISQ